MGRKSIRPPTFKIICARATLRAALDECITASNAVKQVPTFEPKITAIAVVSVKYPWGAMASRIAVTPLLDCNSAVLITPIDTLYNKLPSILDQSKEKSLLFSRGDVDQVIRLSPTKTKEKLNNTFPPIRIFLKGIMHRKIPAIIIGIKKFFKSKVINWVVKVVPTLVPKTIPTA